MVIFSTLANIQPNNVGRVNSANLGLQLGKKPYTTSSMSEAGWIGFLIS